MQEHHARSLHWDLRLERDGVLVSWAVPKGIPDDPKRNRLAVHVEDHPLSYIDFAGEIPAGGYGAGSVGIWDEGTYETHKFRDDEVIVTFHGSRIQGKYALFQTKGKNWMIHRMDPPLQDGREPMPERLVPMPASAGRLPADDEEWGFEIKWDGVRAIAYWQPNQLRIESRNLNDVSARYPELRALGPQLGSREGVLDGEIVAFDEQGRPSFERLQRRMHISSTSVIRRLADEAPVSYVIFDLLYLDGHTTMALPYRERRALLEGLELKGPAWQTPAYHAGEGRELLAAAVEQSLEGVVAKRLASPYRPGKRTDEWLKIKNVNRQELVIGGWLPGKGARAGRLGALLMGYYEPGQPASERSGDEDEQGHASQVSVLRYAGRVGTGFDDGSSSAWAGSWRRTRGIRVRSREPSRRARPASSSRSSWPRSSSGSGRETASCGTPSTRDCARTSRRRKCGSRRKPHDRRAPYEIVRETKRATEVEVAGSHPEVDEPREGDVPAHGVHEGRADRLLRRGCTRAAAPSRRPAADAQALSGRGRGRSTSTRSAAPPHRPAWVRTAPIESERGRGTIDYCLAEDLPTLIWAANLADIELHPSLSRAARMDRPTAVVFDLDPGAPAGLKDCCRVALKIKEMFDSFGLDTFVKTSGAKGLQVYVPLNSNPVDYEQTKPFARAVAELLEKRHPAAGPLAHGQGPAPREGADRLESERRAQDDRLRLLAARPRAPDDLHAAGLG